MPPLLLNRKMIIALNLTVLHFVLLTNTMSAIFFSVANHDGQSSGLLCAPLSRCQLSVGGRAASAVESGWNGAARDGTGRGGVCWSLQPTACFAALSSLGKVRAAHTRPAPIASPSHHPSREVHQPCANVPGVASRAVAPR